ncbi:MAG: hypothetical protein AVDCRST_MAG48-648, partial [uncultured Friedmanniella sp.]
ETHPRRRDGAAAGPGRGRRRRRAAQRPGAAGPGQRVVV